MTHVIDNACAGKFQNSFLLRPKACEGNVGERGGKDGFRLLRTHRVTDKVFLCLVDALDVQTTGTVTDEATDSLLAMTDAEINVGIVFQERFAVLVEFKLRLPVNAEAEAESPQQFRVSDSTLSPTLQVLEAQRLFAPPFGQRGYEPFRLRLGEFRYVVVDAEYVHLRSWIFNSNFKLESGSENGGRHNQREPSPVSLLAAAALLQAVHRLCADH